MWKISAIRPEVMGILAINGLINMLELSLTGSEMVHLLCKFHLLAHNPWLVIMAPYL